MLSRVAESIYWMARYVERAENLARFVDVNLNLNLSRAPGAPDQWEPLIFTTGDEEYFRKRYGAPTAENVVTFLAFDADYPNSIVTSLNHARENARTIREAISSEAWEQLNDCYHFVRGARPAGDAPERLIEFFNRVKQQSHLFCGIVDGTMSHGDGWCFANLGRMLERADKTSRILDVKYFTLLPDVEDVNTTFDDLQWSAVLRSVSGFEMYRKRFHAIAVRRVAEFLILDDQFPRAIRFCLEAARDSLDRIVGRSRRAGEHPSAGLLHALCEEVSRRDIDDVLNQGMHEFVDDLQTRLNAVGASIHETYFDRRPLEAAAAIH